MTADIEKNWQAIVGLVSELKRCGEYDITTASVAMAYICIDGLANLARPTDKAKVTRSDFKQWVDTHLQAHPGQLYQYRGKDVYAARCALLHKYGSEAELHKKDKDTIMFAYHDGGEHQYNPEVNKKLAIIGTKSFINDVVYAVESFLNLCKEDKELRKLVEERLPSVLQTLRYPQ